MKFITRSMIILPAVLFFVACGGKDKKEGEQKETEKQEEKKSGGPATKLEGTWEIKRAEGSMQSMNLGTIYEFKGSKLTMSKGSFKNPGTTIVTDTSFSFQAEGNELKFMMNYRFDGDTLVVTVPNSDGQVFHLLKK